MNGTKVMWGQLAAVFAIALAGVWTATQWTAWRLAFQSELGAPWFELVGWPIYPPPAFFWWWFSFDAYAPDIFKIGAFIAASGGFVSIAVAIGTFGAASGQALAGVVGPLIEVPVLVGLVYVSLWAAKAWFHTDPYATEAVTESRTS